MPVLNIKPIETLYKGYRFRSRLEARWAVFFDTLGVRWEYEKEGFELSTGERYLPDFYLPDDKLWVEVKGEQPDRKYMKMLDRFHDNLGCAILLVIGMPGENQGHLMAYDVSESAGSYDNDCVDIAAVSGGRLELITCTDASLVWHRTVYSDELFENELNVKYLPDRVLFSDVCKAIDTAKSARFEFGETLR